MVQEAQPAIDVSISLLLLHGCRDHLWLRFAAHRHASVLDPFQQMYNPWHTTTLRRRLTRTVFGEGYKDKDGKPSIEPSIIGFMSACYQLGSILAVPIAPWVNQKYGRRFSVMLGSVIMVVGALLQGFAQHSKFTMLSSQPWLLY